MTPIDYHWLGKRDAMAELFMMIRRDGERKSLREIARQLLTSDAEHCHAKWYIDNHPEAAVISSEAEKSSGS